MHPSSWVAAAFASEDGARAALRYILGAGLQPISSAIRAASGDTIAGSMTILDLELRAEDADRFPILAKGAHGVVVPGRPPDDNQLEVVA